MRGAFGMYPTNELARDQRRQFSDYKADFSSPMRFEALSLHGFILQR
jgi:CRISPR-associated endonuclease/helicase Cas3